MVTVIYYKYNIMVITEQVASFNNKNNKTLKNLPKLKNMLM